MSDIKLGIANSQHVLLVDIFSGTFKEIRVVREKCKPSKVILHSKIATSKSIFL